jgi:hypothetical protein
VVATMEVPKVPLYTGIDLQSYDDRLWNYDAANVSRSSAIP